MKKIVHVTLLAFLCSATCGAEGFLEKLGIRKRSGTPSSRKTLEGLFLKIAEEEKRIRENLSARANDLLQKVFGSIKK